MTSLFDRGWIKAIPVKDIYFKKAESGKILVEFENGSKDIYEKTGRLEDPENE